MTKINYTASQEEAIFTINKNIIVSAQAGAGKTQVLVARIINLIETENIDINEMLIVTFTNKAASELKDRIRKELQKKIDSSDFSNKLFYQKQYNKTINAQISTMHSFCITLLRAYFYKLGINPGFKLLKNSSLDLIKWKSINDVFDKMYIDGNKEFFNLINTYSKKYSDENIKSMILSIYDFIQAQIYPMEWFQEKIDLYRDDNDFKNKDSIEKLKIEIFNFYKSQFDNLYLKFIKTKDEITKIYEKYNINLYQENIENDLDFLEKLYKIDNFDKFFYEVSLASFSNKKRITSKFLEENGIEDSIKDEISNMMDSYRNAYKKFFASSIVDINVEVENEIKMKKILITIYNIISEFELEFKKNKIAQNALDFSDLEHLIIKLLDDEEVVKNVKDKYKYIFFDEYQDSNQIQDYIINKIKSKDNLFFVGDIKQSIYKFRLADPIIFKERYNLYARESDDNKSIDLVENFRSEKNVLNFNNFIFSNIMTENVGDVNFDTSGHRFNPGKKDDEYSNNSIIESNYIFLDKEEYSNAEFSNEILEIDPEVILAEKKITELINKGYAYRDIAILSRTTSSIRKMQMYLSDRGIPNYSDSNIFSYEDIEIKVFIQILKSIENDTDDIVLLSTLCSALGGFTDEDIARIRGEIPNKSFYHRFYDSSNTDLLGENLIEKINHYKEKMSKYRTTLLSMSISDFVWYVLVDSGYMSYILSKDNGDKILDNIKLFINEIKELETSTFQTYSSFINYIDKMIDRNLSERESGADLSEEDNVVRLMTIHKSKGLQFKNVILINLNKKFNKMDLNSKVSINGDHGIAISLYDNQENNYNKSFKQIQLNSYKEKELLSEEMRILYVALSRAQSNIYLISSDYSDSINVSNEDIDKMDSYHDWIYSVIGKDDISKSFIKCEKTTNYFSDKSINYKHNTYNASDLYSECVTNEKIFNTKDSIENIDIDEKIKKIVDFNYGTNVFNIPFKKTVSEISISEKNQSSDLKDYEQIYPDQNILNTSIKYPKFIKSGNDKNNNLDSLEIGNLYHYIFEKLPNSLSSKLELEEFLIGLVDKKFVTQFEFNNIDLSILLDYLNSKLYKRISSADFVEKEKSFTMVIKDMNTEKDILVDGQIDLFFEESGELVIVDFKTNKVIDEKLYINQLELYKMGLEKATGKRVKEKIIYWVMHNRITMLEG